MKIAVIVATGHIGNVFRSPVEARMNRTISQLICCIQD